VRILDEADLAAQGFGGILAVGMGSAQPPRLIELSYTPAGAGPRTPHVILIGKGITFDTGGLSLKPREPMVPMKTDMAGGGAVIAAMGALRDLGVRVRVTGLVAAAENMPSGSAQRPGDVITHYGGRTVEVRNTDAEGRLVLADALAYAVARLSPDAIVDLATLTGAASLGLGRRHAALYATDDALGDALVEAGRSGGERLWRMPLVEDYRASLDSDVADLCHISLDHKIQGGSITAALFLREFAGDRPWAHLDIAGPARADGDEHEVTKGATGFGTRTLLRWLESRRPLGRPR
jgi:leucyl aminopeptidase